VAGLAHWFHQSGATSLETYLEAFSHTYGVMQTPEAMRRVASEAVEDMAAAGVVYAEIRFAPSLHTSGGMTRHAAIEAVLSGLEAAEASCGVPARVIVDALRQQDDSLEVAAAAADFVGAGVVAFDLAGPERGHPPEDHQLAIDRAREAGLRITIHAGEGDGVGSIAAALACGAERLGHGVRLIEDTVVEGGRVVAMGAVATEVHRRRIPLEVAPISNLDTKMYPSPADHPVGLLHRAGFVVTLNTDNRLMSATSMEREFATVMEHCGIALGDLAAMTRNAVGAAFCDEATRARVAQRVEAGYV
jgi:adenosine deaminase